MKIEINIETNDRNWEFTLWPHWERESPPESELKINVKNNPSSDDIKEEAEMLLKQKQIEDIECPKIKI